MSDIKFTPGPWKVQDDGHGLLGVLIKAGLGVLVGKKNNKNLANAYLIASSPELYEALKAIVNKTSCGLDQGMKVADLCDEIIDAERALAKARGEKQ